MKRTGLLVAVVLVVLVACAARESAGLPWEEAQRLLFKQQMRSGANGAAGMSKRDLGTDIPICPDHPRAVPQAFINQRFMPEQLREAIKKIDAVYRTAAQGVQAMSVGIVYDQELVWGQGYGLIDTADPSSQVDTNTIYRVGSITKLITNIMLFQLRDQGKLSLDDPVSKYVPELVWPTPFKNNPGITWRTLAGQISGLTGATPCNFFTILEPFLGDACQISNAEAWKRVTADPPSVPMWQNPHYADGAYAIIGRALESVVGMSYEDYITQHIFKPLGMDSSFLAYNSGRTWPRGAGNITFPSFVAHADLNWARATGNVYSTVKDLAKLASLFMVGQDERKNVLGIYSSTLREMLTPSFINDDQTSGYGFPFEVYHSRAFGKDMPPYWVRIKAGSMPGYVSVLAMFPEIKTAMIMQANGYAMPWEPIALLLPAIEQTLWDLQPIPNNPGNLTAYAGTYLASVLGGFMTGNVTVKSDLPNNQLLLFFSLAGTNIPASDLGVTKAVWEHDNTFRTLGPNPGTAACPAVEAGFTNVLVHFKVGDPSWFGGPTQVVSFEAPTDPFYGWVFIKQ
ncbi:betalactamase [Acanthamoeba castellanii str. Neff]|uniref:Betalactamase n=1 Tax=Acanthamoeba castellanii (strain ATCC 30010 / Neff) TaxID=1257118 RepID=L8GU04_ACACF|nr:betalactamase [Acanthamoeba castellanii str. Neff]ELR16649.1 betalactamase [Acanthamoeba castellanii str. Neff]